MGFCLGAPSKRWHLHARAQCTQKIDQKAVRGNTNTSAVVSSQPSKSSVDVGFPPTHDFRLHTISAYARLPFSRPLCTAPRHRAPQCASSGLIGLRMHADSVVTLEGMDRYDGVMHCAEFNASCRASSAAPSDAVTLHLAQQQQQPVPSIAAASVPAAQGENAAAAYQTALAQYPLPGLTSSVPAVAKPPVAIGEVSDRPFKRMRRVQLPASR